MKEGERKSESGSDACRLTLDKCEVDDDDLGEEWTRQAQLGFVRRSADWPWGARYLPLRPTCRGRIGRISSRSCRGPVDEWRRSQDCLAMFRSVLVRDVVEDGEGITGFI